MKAQLKGSRIIITSRLSTEIQDMKAWYDFWESLGEKALMTVTIDSRQSSTTLSGLQPEMTLTIEIKKFK